MTVPLEFILFGATPLGVAQFHNYTLPVGLTGLVFISGYKIFITGFAAGAGLSGFALHLVHEWVTLLNLLSRHFEKSHLPLLLPKYLPPGWMGGFIMLVVVFVLSGFLDNFAAAMIGGTMAHQLFRAKVHIGYVAGFVVMLVLLGRHPQMLSRHAMQSPQVASQAEGVA